MIRVAINGYGRIGRVAHRVILEKFTNKIEIVAINTGSSTDIEGWSYLLKYDTVYGALKGHSISFKKAQELSTPGENYIGSMMVDGKEIIALSEKDVSKLPWNELKIDVVIESTGHLTTNEKLKQHINAGAKSVVLSAPFKDESNLPTYVLGVNLNNDSKINTPIFSNASCTTNCITPVAKIIEENFGIEKAMMTTIHAYTSDQKLADGGHKDPRRARAAAQNIIPTSTGATIAAGEAFGQIKGKFSGLAIRVPVVVGSLSDFTFLTKKNVTAEEVNKAFETAENNQEYKGILRTTRDPIVSSDIIGETYSAVVDLSLTQVVSENLVKVIAWYDNEYGYANRLIEEVIISQKNSEEQKNV